MDSIKQFDRFIPIKEVSVISSLCRSQIYALAKRDKFPKPYKLTESQSTRCSRWSFLEVNEWVAEMIKSQKVS